MPKKSVENNIESLSQKRGEMPYHEHCNVLKWDTLDKRREYISFFNRVL